MTGRLRSQSRRCSSIIINAKHAGHSSPGEHQICTLCHRRRSPQHHIPSFARALACGKTTSQDVSTLLVVGLNLAVQIALLCLCICLAASSCTSEHLIGQLELVSAAALSDRHDVSQSHWVWNGVPFSRDKSTKGLFVREEVPSRPIARCEATPQRRTDGGDHDEGEFKVGNI